MREDSPTDEPLSPYAATKKMGEMLCHVYGQLYKFNIVIARYFTVYGPAGRPDMAPLRFIAKAIEGQAIEVYGDGEQRRDFTYIDDVVDATVAMLDLRGYNILNVGSGYPKNLWDLIDAIKHRYRVITRPKCEELIIHARQIASCEGDVPSTYADNSLAHKMLYWQPKVMLEEGIQKTVEWYLENRDEVREALKEVIFYAIRQTG
jgi:nucleoside-diphosphate-sugar epimerase